jgi:L-lactate dehydrogenase complex protein LldE
MRVGLFVTCLVDLMRPSVGFAALRLLEHAGCDVVVPERQTCCGQPAYNAGDKELARALAAKCAEDFAGCDHVVAPSGACAGMLRVHYPRLFQPDSPVGQRVQSLASRTYELTDFLVTIAKLDHVPGNYVGEVTYHDACSGLRELGVKNQPRDLLAKLPGLALKEMSESETCCGFGGTFSVKFGEVSAQLAANKCRNAQASGAQAVAGGDLGCLLNIEGRLRRTGDYRTRVLHVAEILAGDQGDVPCK